MFRVVGFLLWLCELGHDAKEWLRKQWRKHVISDVPEHMDLCESCRVVNCDCTKVKNCENFRSDQ